jgi:CDP-diacylglycerol--glycerol-3-phosphate 3-phosphatidyltransferase
MATEETNRRPIAARSANWARDFSALLSRSAVTPNQISVFSVLFAMLGAAAILVRTDWVGLIFCALCIQGRLLCNLLDGMVALEGGKKSVLGVLYNEFPDRIADSILIVALGYATPYPYIGWLGALAATLTAYVRVFGGALGLSQDFRGPMAKQHRMAVMTATCLIAAIEGVLLGTHTALLYAAILIAAGSIITCATRTLAICRRLQEQA